MGCFHTKSVDFIVKFFALVAFFSISSNSQDTTGLQRFKIEGKVTIPSEIVDQNWVTTTRVLVDGGEHLGFLRSDGSFAVHNMPKGSYVVDIVHPAYAFESARVDITSSGKIRARRLNNIQPSAVNHLPYPLKFKPRGSLKYFQVREQWRITDFLFNHMVLMMVLPFLVIVLLPKLVNTNDPEAQREMQNQMNMFNPRPQLPEVSEMITSWLGGGSNKKTSSSSGSSTKPKPRKQR